MDQLIQQVNLYQPVFHKKREPFSAGIMLVIVLIALVIMSMATGFSLYQLDELEEAGELLAMKNQSMLEKLEEIKEKLQPREKNQLLLAKRDSLELDLRDARRLSRLLDQEIQEDTKPYSTYFRGLAESTIEGLWLKQLKISQAGNFLRLSGHTLKPEFVPRLLQSLKKQPAFKGHDFGDVQMLRDSDAGLEQPVLFYMQTMKDNQEQVDAG